MRSTKHGVWSMPFALAVAAAIVSVTSPAMHAATSQNPNPRLYLPGTSPFGASFGEWTAAWWRWAFSLPVANHPLFDTGSCDTGQAGPVWFLGGAFTGTATIRDCTVPAGTALLIPVLNSECSDVEPPPFFGADEAEMLACARAFMDTGTDLFASIDGRAVDDLALYRVSSPLYSFSAPDGGLFGGATAGNSVSDGVWLFLQPLAPGEHTIHFGGSFPGFPLDVTYNLTVQPGGRRRGAIDAGPGAETSTWGLVKSLYR